MMPGHMREAGMQYPGHPPDVSTIMPHQMPLESSHQNHNVVLQTPLGTFHRYNSALQQHLSMNRPIDYPQQAQQPHHLPPSRAECPHREGQRDKEECEDVKPRDFHNVPKFKMEEGSVPPNHYRAADQRASREETRDGRPSSRSGSPLIRDSISVGTSDSGSPKSDIFPQGSSQAPSGWSSMARQHQQPGERQTERPRGSSSSDLSEHEVSKKRRVSEGDEMMIQKMQKFWTESGGSGCPIGGAGFPGGVAGAMASSLPMSVLQNPSLMSAYRKEAMMQFHQQQQQQYQHHKQFQPNHHPQRSRYHSESNQSEETHRQYPVPPRQNQISPEERTEQSRSPAGSPDSNRADASGVHLPELKNALARPPLSSPGWSGEHGRSESESENVQDIDAKYSTDTYRDTKENTSPSDPYFMHKKLKMKRRSSNDTVNSEGSVPDQDGSLTPQQRSPPALPYSHMNMEEHQTEEESQLQSQNSYGNPVMHDREFSPEARHRSQSVDLPPGSHGQHESRRGSVTQEGPHDIDPAHEHLGGRPQTDPPVLMRSPQFAGDSTSHECRNSPPMLIPETERRSQPGQPGQHIDRQRSPQRVAKPPHTESDRHSQVAQHKDSKIRHTNIAYENNNNNKYFSPEVSRTTNDVQGDEPQQSRNKTGPGLGAGHPHSMPNGVCGNNPYMGPSGVSPHPAYLPLPFPSMHPAMLYQYNHFAAAQMAQLQQLQMAQAQMALHHQVALSKADNYLQGAQRKDGLNHQVPLPRGALDRHREDEKKGPASR